MRVVLTGGIATGKSHVLDRFAAAGVPTSDADRFAHDAIAPGGPSTPRGVSMPRCPPRIRRSYPG